MIGPVLQFEDLQQICKPGEHPRLATVEGWARTSGIKYQYDGRGGIWTTLDALNYALGLRTEAVNAPNYTAEDLL
ncbi:hypothetical protein AO826_20555 [Xanthomonas phaseoli pv. manihotis]|nr:hypothetical protein [Xanthomonas phaseoli]KUF35094.1 hypothetical protein AO826_20555 [Xanthomonas phaseoli pv. manihotis]